MDRNISDIISFKNEAKGVILCHFEPTWDTEDLSRRICSFVCPFRCIQTCICDPKLTSLLQRIRVTLFPPEISTLKLNQFQYWLDQST